MLSIYAALEADLAVAPMLVSSVPDSLMIMPPEASLPALPHFDINMYLPKVGAADIGKELALHIREQFQAQRYRAA